MKVKKILSLLGAIPVIFFLSSCKGPKVTVDQMDRGFLADYLMRKDRDDLSVMMFDHAFFSREASRGGKSIASGGCGCN
tara:strand:+ start:2293 stop:2529 length:237 start_codon:yes stop_codon:yes gene_type:complete